MDTWRGHFPIIDFVLRALLKKKAEAETTDLSRAEGVLFNACEFWAAVLLMSKRTMIRRVSTCEPSC
jgi:hypothetical protein